MDNWKQAKSDSPKLGFYNKIKTEFVPGKYLTLVLEIEKPEKALSDLESVLTTSL